MSVQKKMPKNEGRVVVHSKDHDGDLSKLWYVHWRENGKTRKKYGKLAHISDLSERRSALDALKLEWQLKIDSSVIEPIIQLLRDWLLRQKVEMPWRWKTWQTNNSKITVLEDWLAGRPVNAVTLAEFFTDARQKYHPVTFNRYIQEFKSYFTGIGQAGIFPDVKPIKKARKKSRPAQWLKRTEVDNLKTAIETKYPLIWLAVRFMYNLALRPGELRLLKAENIFLDEGVAYIPANVSKVGVERWVTIPPDFIPDLEFIRSMSPNEYIFKSTQQKRALAGEPVGKNYFSRMIRKVMDENGFDAKYKPAYSFRYTMAMRGLKDDKVPAEQMQMQFGHHSLDQFLYYCRQFNVFDMNTFKEKFTGL